MTRCTRHRLAAVLSAALFGCASPVATHFYTLMPVPTADSVVGAVPVAPTWELLPVTVPTQVDQPPWVVRLLVMRRRRRLVRLKYTMKIFPSKWLGRRSKPSCLKFNSLRKSILGVS